MRTLEAPTLFPADPESTDASLGDPEKGDDASDKDNDIDKVIADIRARASTIGLSPEATEEAVADYQKSQNPELEDGEETSLDALMEEAREIFARMDETLRNMQELNAEIVKSLQKIIKMLELIIEYAERIAEAKTEEEKKALHAELQEEIDKV